MNKRFYLLRTDVIYIQILETTKKAQKILPNIYKLQDLSALNIEKVVENPRAVFSVLLTAHTSKA